MQLLVLGSDIHLTLHQATSSRSHIGKDGQLHHHHFHHHLAGMPQFLYILLI